MTQPNGAVLDKQVRTDIKRYQRILNRLFGFKEGFRCSIALRLVEGDQADVRILLSHPTREVCEILGKAMIAEAQRYPSMRGEEAPQEAEDA